MNFFIAITVITLLVKFYGEPLSREFRELRSQIRGGRHICVPPRWRALGEQWRCPKCEQVWERDSGFWFYNPSNKEEKMVRFSWNALLCEDCWYKREPRRDPVRVVGDTWGQCSMCGNGTPSGIYVRMNPEDQNFPQEEAYA